MGEEIFMGRYLLLEEEEERKKERKEVAEYEVLYTHSKADSGIRFDWEWLTGWTQKIRSVESDPAGTEIRRRNCSESPHGFNTL